MVLLLIINSKNNFYWPLFPDYLLKFAIILSFPFSTIFPSAVRANAVHDKRLYTIDRAEYDSFAEHFLLPEDFDLASRTPTRKPTPLDLDGILNQELFEGDILGIDERTLPPNEHQKHPLLMDIPLVGEEDGNNDYGLFSAGGRRDESAIFAKPVCPWQNPSVIPIRPFGQQFYSSLNTQTYADKLWHQGNVPYMLEEGMTPSQRAAIASAFDEYKGKTCIRFLPKRIDDPDYIYIKRNQAFGCSSYVGRAGGNQTVSLEVDKCFSKGIIAHELMHALGFFHEHSRTDRDEFVEILEENVRPGMLRNFEKYPRKIIDPLGMPYDYDSVMHYHKLAFSRNGRSTIVPKKRDAEIGQRYKLSEIDAKKVNKLYRCDDEPTTSTTTTTMTTATTTTVISTTTEEIVIEETMTTASGEESSSALPSIITDEPATETITTEAEREMNSTVDRGEGSESTATMEPNGSEEGEERISRAGMRSRGSGSREEKGGEGNWPRKFITLSIWSMRGGVKKVPVPLERKSKRKGLNRIKEKNGGSKRVEKECIDLNAHCEMWEKLGHCVHSAKYMRHYCRKACGLCDKDERTEQENSRFSCTDRNHFCSYWARNGECDNGSKFMQLFCKRSCGLC